MVRLHPIGQAVTDAAEGRHPPTDGTWRRVAPWRPGLQAIVAFTANAVLAVDDDVTDDLLADLGVHGLGGAHDPRVIAALAGPDGWIDSLDVLVAARGAGTDEREPRLIDRPDLAGHPRARRAADLRDDLRVLGYPDRGRSAVAVVSRGVGGLCELSFELEAHRRGSGGGIALIHDALTCIPAGRLTVAAVAPGNASSLRALLAAGFTPVGSLQLYRRTGQTIHSAFSGLNG